jgi:hypothetical protein
MTLCETAGIWLVILVQRNVIDKKLCPMYRMLTCVPQYTPLHHGGSQIILEQRNVIDKKLCPMYRMLHGSSVRTTTPWRITSHSSTKKLIWLTIMSNDYIELYFRARTWNFQCLLKICSSSLSTQHNADAIHCFWWLDVSPWLSPINLK